MIIFIVLLVVLSYVWVAFQQTKKPISSKSIPTVSTVTIRPETYQPTLDAIGIFQANQGTILKAQTDGQVQDVRFSAGDQVHTGDLLLVLNNTQQKAALDAAIAQQKLNIAMYQRDQELKKLGAISLAAVDQAKAAVEGGDAAVKEAQSAYELTMISAPFSGRLGISKVHLGDYLQVGDAIVSLQNIDPMLIDFYVPQKYFSSIQVGKTVIVQANTTQTPLEGKIINYETVVDQTTGMLQVRAAVPNVQQQLLPGGYATLKININEEESMITIPQTAIIYDAEGAYVYIIQKDIAHAQRITLGQQVQQNIQVMTGLKENDVIVAAGTNKIRENSQVNIIPERSKAEL